MIAKMANSEHLELLRQGASTWNAWRKSDPSVRPDLSKADLRHVNLCGADLRDAILCNANLSAAKLKRADLRWPADLHDSALIEANLRGANLRGADLSGARLIEADLNGADLSEFFEEKPHPVILSKADLQKAILHDANLSAAILVKANLRNADLTKANLSGADLSDANLTGADLTGANLSGANISGATLSGANLSGSAIPNIKWHRHKMHGKYLSIRGLDSCYGNAFFKREAADQDFLDSLEEAWQHSRWKMFWFRTWGLLTDYGRSLWRVAFLAFVLIACYGIIYRLFPRMLKMKNDTGFTPFYFSVVTYTTLGFGDVHPVTFWGEILVTTQVILGYITLGLLLAVLVEKIARRS
ncbi:MAG: pentapeptide repeat-containing protein [Acidobacteria bacterium]|nr:pentapeptide repeat-containing protein [Acidobacteriota bacterium]